MRASNKKRFWFKIATSLLSGFLVFLGFVSTLVVISFFPSSLGSAEFKTRFLEIILAFFSVATAVAFARAVYKQSFISSKPLKTLRRNAGLVLEEMGRVSFRRKELPRCEQAAIEVLQDNSFEDGRDYVDIVSCLLALFSMVVTIIIALLSDKALLDNIHLRSVLIFLVSSILLSGLVAFVVGENRCGRLILKMDESIQVVTKLVERHKKRGRF